MLKKVWGGQQSRGQILSSPLCAALCTHFWLWSTKSQHSKDRSVSHFSDVPRDVTQGKLAPQGEVTPSIRVTAATSALRWGLRNQRGSVSLPTAALCVPKCPRGNESVCSFNYSWSYSTWELQLILPWLWEILYFFHPLCFSSWGWK